MLEHLKQPGAIAVSGCPRSYTTTMMRVFLHAFGRARILGDKWPQLAPLYEMRRAPFGAQRRLARYAWKIRNADHRKKFRKSTQLNKDGFYEVGYPRGWVVRGIRYDLTYADDIDSLGGKVVKLASQGLALTDPIYVERVVMMARDPRVVASSQENLHRPETPQEAGVVHSPEMFNRVTYAAAKWVTMNPQIPVHVVDTNELISDPTSALRKVADFCGDDRIAQQAHIVRPDRSKAAAKPEINKLWADADLTYKKLLRADWQGIVDYYESNDTETHGDTSSWPCIRRGDDVNKRMCDACKSNVAVMRNYRKTAEARGIPWRERPCLYECGISSVVPKPDRLSIGESILKNHWMDGTQGSAAGKSSVTQRGPGCKKRSAMDFLRGAKGLLKAELGMDAVSLEVLQQRRASCEGCRHYEFGVCGKCGCYLAAKARDAKEKCPIGRWKEVALA